MDLTTKLDMGGQTTAIIHLKGYPDEDNHIKGSTVWLKVVSPLPKKSEGTQEGCVSLVSQSIHQVVSHKT